jgi:hypothetical protein
LQALVGEKTSELDRQQAYAGELEDKLKKLLADFGLFRTKAQQMLGTKDEEISKLKGRRNQSSPREPEPKRDDTVNPSKVLGPITQKLNTDYIKNVFIKYLEY